MTTTEALIKSNVQNVANLGEDFVTFPIIGLEDETLPSPFHGAIKVSSASTRLFQCDYFIFDKKTSVFIRLNDI